MKHHSKLTQKEDARQEAELRATTQEAQEFAGVEELLRHDAAQTAVPAGLTRRVQEAAARAPKRRWWQFFGR